MKNKARKLIASGKTKQAIQLLLEKTKGTDWHNEVILLSANHTEYTKEKTIGVLSSEEDRLRISRINNSLLAIVEELDDEAGQTQEPSTDQSTGRKQTEQPPAPDEGKSMKSKSPWEKIGYLALVIGIFAGIAEFSGYSIRDFFTGGGADSFSVTVLVHGKKGKDDRILKNQGKVLLDIGGDRKEETINVQGEATFKELPKGYKDKMALISIDHNQPYFPVKRNKEYQLKPNKVIYLEIELTGLNKIKGRVIDKESEDPLDSVRVSVENKATYTDKFGWFELNIPEEKQAKIIRANFFKEGYIMENLDSIAPHTNQEIGIALKKKK